MSEQWLVMRHLLITLFVLLGTVPLLAKPWVVAHRGGTRLGPENSLATFALARDLGVDAIELDIHQTKDGGLVVIHDSDLDRTFATPGKVAEMTLAELRQVGVPTLREAIEVAGPCRLFVEIKHPHGLRHEGIEERLVAVLREHNLLETAVVISFDATSLKRLHDIEPSLATGYLSGVWVDPARARAELGITYISPHYSKVDAEYLRSVREAGLKLSVWTVNDRDAMRGTVDAGCDAITTDDPALLLQVVEAANLVR